VLAHGAGGAVGSMVMQLAREAGAYVIGTGRAADRETALDTHELKGIPGDWRLFALQSSGENGSTPWPSMLPHDGSENEWSVPGSNR
jgi:hypothetical protein